MAKAVLQSNIQSSDGGLSVAAGATITIRDSDTLALATLYTTRAGAVTTANPTTADSDGFFRVYVNPERRYNITATLGAETQVFNDVIALDAPTSIQVDNVSDLKGLTVTNDLAVYLKGHTSINDGGGGIFIGVTGASVGTYTDDNGTVILPTGGDGSAAWLRVYSGKLNILWFGAVPVSVAGSGADSTTAIQTAVNRASVLRTGVYLPAGIYNFTELYLHYDAVNNPGFSTILSDQTVKLYGDGMMDEFSLAAGEYTGTTLWSTATGSGVYPIRHDRSTLSTKGQEANAFIMSEMNIIGNTPEYIFKANSFVNHARIERVCIHNRSVTGGGLQFGTGSANDRAFDFIIEECLIIGQQNFWAVDPNIRVKNGIELDAESSQNLIHHCYVRGWNIGIHTVGSSNLKLDRTVMLANNIGLKAEQGTAEKGVFLENCHAELNTYINYWFLPTDVAGNTGGNIGVNNTNCSSVVGFWQASYTYAVNTVVRNSGNFYRCTTAGTSAGSGGPTGTGAGIADNTVVWDFIQAVDGSFPTPINLYMSTSPTFGTFLKNARVKGMYQSLANGVTGIWFKDGGNLTPSITDNRFLVLGDNVKIADATDSDANGLCGGVFKRNTIEGSYTYTTITYEAGFREIESDDYISYKPFHPVTLDSLSTNINIQGYKDYIEVTVTGSPTIDTIEFQGGSPDPSKGRKILIYFKGALTLTHNASPTTGQMFLTGKANKSVVANDVLEFVNNGTAWLQV